MINRMKTDFEVVNMGKYSQSELDSMYPWEREVYLILLQQRMQEEYERIKQ